MSIEITWPYGGQQVIVTGEFDDWKQSAAATKGDDGIFRVLIKPPSGLAELVFKFVVDGEWRTSPDFAVLTDALGNANNWVAVELGKSDYWRWWAHGLALIGIGRHSITSIGPGGSAGWRAAAAQGRGSAGAAGCRRGCGRSQGCRRKRADPAAATIRPRPVCHAHLERDCRPGHRRQARHPARPCGRTDGRGCPR
ncbi:immunoglobulin E-set [Entophlyctis helioformis]|nr:immunoglobulin E-set [Entophlyctis helioformis]